MKPLELIEEDNSCSIIWDEGSTTNHLVYEVMCSFINDDLVIILGHEELVLVKEGKEIFRAFTR